jgi:16S rRNA processing protein RimM
MSQLRATPEHADAAGSPVGEPAFLAVGKLRRPHGVHGDVIMDLLTDFPERLLPGITLYVGEVHQPLKLLKCRLHSAAMLVAFEGYTTPEAIGELRNQMVYVRTADRPPLPAGEYYHHQLLGLDVVTDTGLALGTITHILETGANDVLVVRPPVGPKVLLPMIDPVVLAVDLAARQVRVHLLPGILDEGKVEG